MVASHGKEKEEREEREGGKLLLWKPIISRVGKAKTPGIGIPLFLLH